MIYLDSLKQTGCLKKLLELSDLDFSHPLMSGCSFHPNRSGLNLLEELRDFRTETGTVRDAHLLPDILKFSQKFLTVRSDHLTFSFFVRGFSMSVRLCGRRSQRSSPDWSPEKLPGNIRRQNRPTTRGFCSAMRRPLGAGLRLN